MRLGAQLRCLLHCKVFPHIQHSAGTLVAKENTEQGPKGALQWDKEVFKRKEGESGDAKVRGASLREWDV